MNRLGMFVDISHVSAKVMHDVLNITEAPGIKKKQSWFAKSVINYLIIFCKSNFTFIFVAVLNEIFYTYCAVNRK